MVTEHARQRQHPPSAFEPEQGADAWKLRGRGVQRGEIPVESIGRHPVDPGCVAQPDSYLLTLRP